MYKRIMIVIDPDGASRAALSEGLRLAGVHGGELVLHVAVERYPLAIAEAPYLDARSMREFELAARASADRLLAAATVAADRAGVISHGVVSEGNDEVAHIVATARQRRCELIVVASEGRNAVMRLLTGSVVPGLITTSHVPVLVCKPKAAVQAGDRGCTAAAHPKAVRQGPKARVSLLSTEH